MNILEKTRQYFKETIAKSDRDIYNLLDHVPEVERWAIKILDLHEEADREVVMLAVWLHDIGYYNGDKSEDHAKKSEKFAVEFLKKQNISKLTITKVAHCVRSHRNRDIAPETLEAKILACADSASHMTWITYMDMQTRWPIPEVLAKLERDYRDVGLLPEVKTLVTDLYQDWKVLLKECEKFRS